MTVPQRLLFLAAGALLAGSAHASCYVVMDRNGNILAESARPPVDMSLPLSQALAQRFGPGARMSFGLAEADCGTSTDPLGIDIPLEHAQPARAAPAGRSARPNPS